jgi:hypothetical protein
MTGGHHHGRSGLRTEPQLEFAVSNCSNNDAGLGLHRDPNDDVSIGTDAIRKTPDSSDSDHGQQQYVRGGDCLRSIKAITQKSR